MLLRKNLFLFFVLSAVFAFLLLYLIPYIFSPTFALPQWSNVTTFTPCLTNPANGSKTQVGAVSSFEVTATDNNYGILSLNVSENPANPTPLPQSPTITPATPPWKPSVIYTYSPWNPPVGIYFFTIVVSNGAGNSQTCNVSFEIVAGILPWIKTTIGDVHSNTSIYAPNGP